MEKLKAGVVGLGYLGRFHAQKYARIDETELTGLFDTDMDRAVKIAREFDAPIFENLDSLLEMVDLVSIVVPTRHHYEVAKACLEAGVHILLEKPITQTVQEAEELIDLAREKDLVFQVGHLERFNEAVMSLEGTIENPKFVESHRLATFKPRGTDVNVVLDLMIHDIDLVLTLVKSPIESIDAVGIPVLSNEVDIANARLKFDNGCVANFTASRVSRKTMRKIRMFQHDSYVTVDYLANKVTVLRKGGDGDTIPSLPNIFLKEKSFEPGDPLMTEIHAFVDSVKSGTKPIVTGEDGKRALELAIHISRSFHDEDTHG
jgi:predicted dehydrogenase